MCNFGLLQHIFIAADATNAAAAVAQAAIQQAQAAKQMQKQVSSTLFYGKQTHLIDISAKNFCNFLFAYLCTRFTLKGV